MGNGILKGADAVRVWKHADGVVRPYPPAQLCTSANTTDSGLEARYVELRTILDQAFDFSAKGKGAQRHGQNGAAWRDQPHFHIAKEVGLGFPVGQAIKKLREGYNMDEPARSRAEWLGAITYIASAIFALDNGVE